MTNDFVRTWATSPGDLIVDAIDDGLCCREAVRDALHLDESGFESLLGGSLSLSEEMSDALAELLGGSSKFWLEVDAQYKLDLIRLAPKMEFQEKVTVMPKISQGQWGVVL